MAILASFAWASSDGGVATGVPSEVGDFRSSDLVEINRLEPSVRLDVRYATPANFTGHAVYSEARAFLQRPAALALIRAHRALEKLGHGLLIYDGYRPWSVTKLFWDATPPEKRKFVANPEKGSRHNRGCAVDVGLYDRKTGREVPMPSAFDEMSERSAARWPGGDEAQRKARDELRVALEAEGFAVNPDEWWHFDYKDWRSYRIMNEPFSALGESGRQTISKP